MVEEPHPSPEAGAGTAGDVPRVPGGGEGGESDAEGAAAQAGSATHVGTSAEAGSAAAGRSAGASGESNGGAASAAGGKGGAGGEAAGTAGAVLAGGAAGALAQHGTEALPLCAAGTVGARSSIDRPRAVLPWSLTWSGEAGSGGASAEGTAGAAGAPSAVSGCNAAGWFDDVTCRGPAVSRNDDSGLALEFADGSALRYDPSLVPVALSSPALPDGTEVWASYELTSTIVCPFCGAYATRTIEIRDAAGGTILWIGEESAGLDPVDPALIAALFGTTVRYEPVCVDSSVAPGTCVDGDLVEFDIVLETQPEQVVRRGEAAHLVTPGGNYDVLWAASETRNVHSTGCVDGAALTADRAFAAARSP